MQQVDAPSPRAPEPDALPPDVAALPPDLQPRGRSLAGVHTCARCVYDDATPAIRFDGQGVCNYCRMIEKLAEDFGTGTPRGERAMNAELNAIRKDGTGKKYDCIVGISGGTDSSHMLIKAIEWGLRPLAVHYDNTWNTAIASENMRHLLEKLGVDLITHVVDNKEADDIIRAFFEASVPDLDCATDIALAEVLYRAADRYGVKYILEGHAFLTEGIAPLGQSYMDGKYIASVQAQFGRRKLRTYPNMDFASFLKWTAAKRIKKVRPLWYIEYSKEAAREDLLANYGWQYYGGHHLENRITAFYNAYYNTVKFGFDNRCNTMGASMRLGRLTRAEAEAEYARPPYMEEGLITYFKRRLRLSDDEFVSIMRRPKKTFRDYPTYKKRFERWRPAFWVLAQAKLIPMSFYVKYTSRGEIG